MRCQELPNITHLAEAGMKQKALVLMTQVVQPRPLKCQLQMHMEQADHPEALF